MDERIVNSINNFAKRHGLSELISARLYNVVDALPLDIWRKFDCFYCNPPYGSSNGGKSISSFMKRGFEATKDTSVGCVVMSDSIEFSWTQVVLHYIQSYINDNGFIIVEMVPQFHTYHLDGEPNLTSCSIIIKRINDYVQEYNSIPLRAEELECFYGQHTSLKYRYVKDITQREKVACDYELILL